MKKILSLSLMSVALLVISCNNQPEETKKEVITTPPGVIKTDPVIVVKDPPEKSTSVTLDKNGVKIETKKVVVIKH